MNAPIPARTYVSDLSITYNEERQLYIGEFYSGLMLHRIEGPNERDVTYLTQEIIDEQYRQMVRDTNYWREREAARAAEAAVEQAHGRGGGSSSHHDNTPRRIDGIKVQTYHADGRDYKPITVKQAMGWAELVHTAINIATGNYMDLAYTAMSHIIGDWYENIESIWNKKPKQKIFAVSFGGILITATSRAMLRKLLTRQKNLRIQRIMKSVMIQRKEEEDAEDRRQMNLAAYRLREKKRKAEKEFWKDRVRKRNLKEIIGGMRESISDKKNMAENQVEELLVRKLS